MQNTLSSTARRASLGSAVPPAADSSGPTATVGALDSSGVASASASTTRSVATGPSEVASRSVVALSSGEATPSVPAASTSRTEVDSPRSQRVARDRKVEQVDPGVTLSPPAKVVDAKHAGAAVQAITLSPASRQALGALAQAVGEFNCYYTWDGRPVMARGDVATAQAALRKAATAFQDSLDSHMPRQAQLADAVLKCLADALPGGQMDHPYILRPMAKHISQCLELTDALIDRLTPGVAESLKDSYSVISSRHESNIWRGLVEASMTGQLGASFTSHEPSEETQARLSHLAGLSLERPVLAEALGDARFHREPETRQLGRGMDPLGQLIVKRATVASQKELIGVARVLTEYVEAGDFMSRGLDWWRCALEPYFRGSLASDNPNASIAVMVGVLVEMSRSRRRNDERLDEGVLERPHRLNLDDVAATFGNWASEASPKRRELVHEALAYALLDFHKGFATLVAEGASLRRG